MISAFWLVLRGYLDACRSIKKQVLESKSISLVTLLFRPSIFPAWQDIVKERPRESSNPSKRPFHQRNLEVAAHKNCSSMKCGGGPTKKKKMYVILPLHDSDQRCRGHLNIGSRQHRGSLLRHGVLFFHATFYGLLRQFGKVINLIMWYGSSSFLPQFTCIRTLMRRHW